MPNYKLEGHELVEDPNAPESEMEGPDEDTATATLDPKLDESALEAAAPDDDIEDTASATPDRSFVVDDGPYNPSHYTIEDVKKYVGDNPDEAQRILDLEVDGKNRTTLVDWLTGD
jgi:hypothetical protein